jgi:hypothetical protein
MRDDIFGIHRNNCICVHVTCSDYNVILKSLEPKQMTPQESTQFKNACRVIRKFIPDDNEIPAMFELVVTRIVKKALEEM